MPSSVSSRPYSISSSLTPGKAVIVGGRGLARLDLSLTLSLIALGAGLFGIALAWIFYIQKPGLPNRIAASLRGLYDLLWHKYYIDEIYNRLVTLPLFWISTVILSQTIDRGIIDGMVNGTGLTVEGSGEGVRRAETGNLQHYAFVYLIGVIGIAAYYVYLVISLMDGFLLTALIFVPLIGAFGVLMQSDEDVIWRSAFIFSLIPLALSFYLFFAFQPHVGGYQFVERYNWIPQFGISYHLGVDGISLFLVLLTTILISLSMFYSAGGDIEVRAREFCFMMLILETGLLGTLLALDVFLFYVFWEAMLVPMYLLIGIWGHGAKIYATFKFVLFTMAGSLLMLVAILYLGAATNTQLGHLSFDLPDLYRLKFYRDRGAMAVRRLRPGLCDQSAAMARAYLAARCAYRGADRGFRHPGGRDAQNGHLRLSALCHPAFSRSRD